MDELKRINQQFTRTYILYLVVFLLFGAVAITAGFLIRDSNLEFIVFLLLIIVLMVVSVFFKSYLDRIQNVSYLIRIMRNASGPLELNHMKEIPVFEAYARQKDFVLYSQAETFKVFYKAEKDHINRIRRRYILQVLVLLSPSEPIFFSDKADVEINKLNQELLKKKMKISRMLVSQIKPVDELNESNKQALKEIVFYRSKRETISVINVALDKNTNKAVMLYSDTYSPSQYYKYHVDQLKTLI
ncbi:hypothetical protein N7548_06470 [Acholeplasma manati]|uniref:Uncharacterized protein n=1 Tax=Paracholeplasma manati TaxID=591373 RepID=A0ABT2Y6V8_9MOLU|nr:hypothetical protein [Paracholeplasma manati]MCV2232467.1 hypothetical protein [Paracholeplasma manati]